MLASQADVLKYAYSRHQVFIHRDGVDSGPLVPTKSSSADSMKNAIGTFDRCRSELDIRSKRLMVLSWIPPGGRTQEMLPSLTGTPDFLSSPWTAACVLASRPISCASRLRFSP